MGEEWGDQHNCDVSLSPSHYQSIPIPLWITLWGTPQGLGATPHGLRHPQRQWGPQWGALGGLQRSPRGCGGVAHGCVGLCRATLLCAALHHPVVCCAVLTGVRLCSPCPAVLGQTRTHRTEPYPYTNHSRTMLCCTYLLEGQPSRA